MDATGEQGEKSVLMETDASEPVHPQGTAPLTAQSDVIMPGKSETILPVQPATMEPLQLVHTGEDGELTVHVASLERLLQTDHVKDRRLVVLSVVGAFRKGKSFLLDFLLNYLRADGAEGWLENGVLGAGFSWRAGSERDTTGILVWPQPFLVGDDLAVLLVDTQGMFDDQTDMKQNTLIFALSTLMSSVQVFNVSHQIQMNDMHYLQFFVEYGRIVEEKCNTKPFQKLMFLVRDWKYHKEYNFGLEGGQAMLDEKWMKGAGNNSERQRACDSISSCFSDVGCFLLPHPGPAVDCGYDFTGNLEEIDHKFSEHLKDLVEGLLSPEHLVAKMVGGVHLRAGEFPAYVRGALQGLQHSDVPEPRALMECIAAAAGEVAGARAREVYEAHMEEVCLEPVLDLQHEHHVAHDTALHVFEAKARFGGDQQIVADKRRKLEEELDDQFQKYVNLNEANLERLQEAQIMKSCEDTDGRWRSVVAKQQQQIHELIGDRAYDLIESRDQNEILEMKVGFAMFGPPGKGYSVDQGKEINKVCSKIKVEAKKLTNEQSIYFAALFIHCIDLKWDKTSVEVVFRIGKSHTSNECVFIDNLTRVYKNWADFLNNNKYNECWYCYPKDGYYQGDHIGTVQVAFDQSPACNFLRRAGKVLDVVAKVAIVGTLAVGTAAVFIPFAGPLITTGTYSVAGIATTYSGARGVNIVIDRSTHSQSINLNNSESIGAWLDIVTTPLVFASSIKSLKLAFTTASDVTMWGQFVQRGFKLVDLIKFAGDLSAKSLSIILQIVTLFLLSPDGILSAEAIAQLRHQILFYYHVFIEEAKAAKIFNDLGESLHRMLTNVAQRSADSILHKVNRSSLVGKAVLVLGLVVCDTAPDLIQCLQKSGFVLPAVRAADMLLLNDR